ncbi:MULTISPECIES: lipopolysaccharide kinase InaA family protein [Pseudomonas]|jgi:tRNA A-37 threonylcarbamoyl transferase component Bud32|uniref:lipopolysaccharide kinase InaA family protein n=1 Tax=Pseudomonas TaxID=286 RepID=UPI000F023D60|nr:MULTISPECIES: lipopolysaccharide kinase InaA family protein [Pseudomonas]MDH1259034.1 lipopolysaccharide kinase InaA family protein [Pseudomonas atacamensis]MDH2081041.1 lipopolysaccharide kinase InaA family protein [Pseudomonas atacamensis]MEB2856258.1 lipopolysaccharide kinase InaA family protein [Pseudomonas atacamensis]
MQSIDHSTYEALRKGAQVLEADGSGDKVLRLADGRMLKLFRRKRLLSSALFFPYAQRFANNTKALQQRDILCPNVIAVYRIPSIQRDGVYYAPLAGETVRQLQGTPEETETLRSQLGAFIAQLHEKGVYFRSLHFGNVVQTPQNQLGLIDIADLRCQRRALSDSKRLRNFAHLLRYKQDRQWLLGGDAGSTFLEGYRQALPSKRQAALMERLRLLLN